MGRIFPREQLETENQHVTLGSGPAPGDSGSAVMRRFLGSPHPDGGSLGATAPLQAIGVGSLVTLDPATNIPNAAMAVRVDLQRDFIQTTARQAASDGKYRVPSWVDAVH